MKKPFLIAGPCSAESEKHIFEIAKNISPYIDVFRAGLWKARTHHDYFSGVGELGLTWLKQLYLELGLKTSTEIANTNHVEKCLYYNIDMLWIGARTVTNPFSIQEIAESLRGTQKTVIIKNPIHPDIKAWIGAIERIKKANIKNIILVHRGFFLGNKNKYRNEPIWEIPLKVKKMFPEHILLCDPSHISGDKKWVYEISKEALLKNKMNGLMIEVHVKPELSLCDKKQHINNFDLEKIYYDLF